MEIVNGKVIFNANNKNIWYYKWVAIVKHTKHRDKILVVVFILLILTVINLLYFIFNVFI